MKMDLPTRVTHYTSLVFLPSENPARACKVSSVNDAYTGRAQEMGDSPRPYTRPVYIYGLPTILLLI